LRPFLDHPLRLEALQQDIISVALLMPTTLEAMLKDNKKNSHKLLRLKQYIIIILNHLSSYSSHFR
jgi:hypothetical protein